MAEALFSPSWYRVSRLRPRMRGHTRIHRHDYRGEVWYVLQDHAKGRYYRFTPSAYQVIGRMNGQRTVEELWEEALDRLGDEGPNQNEIVQLLSQLHSADVLLCDVPPDTAELLRRSEKIARSEWTQRLRSPLALRFPLVDPERFLARTIKFVRPLFSVYGAVLWLGIVGTAVVLGALHWSELTENLADRVLAAQNLVLIWFAYPLVKALHELGHGYAVKTWGGEVHEMGIMLLVFMPVPYVDASAASEYRARHRRVVVGAGGILVELLVASIALFLWLNLDSGLARSFAYNVVLIGSVSTLFFNGNPLLRYDGYYILADLLSIPNLAQRGMNYLGYVVKQHVFRMKRVTPPHWGPGERFWFVLYTVAAFIYRIFIYTAIVLFVAGKFFFIGILLAMWAMFSMIVRPVGKGLKFIFTDSGLRGNRPRAVALTAGVVGLVLVLLFVVPFPSWTRAEGVIWVPEESLVRAGTDGFVERVLVESESRVRAGQPLVECRDPLLRANANVLRARLDELRTRYDAALAADKVQASIVAREIESARADLARADERLAELEIRSPGEGRLLLPRAQDLPGRYLKHGELLAYVLDVERPTIRVVVPQSKVDLVRRRTRGVEVRFAERLARVYPADVMREVPGAVDRLPSMALGSIGGGEIAVDPRDAAGTTAIDKLFQFDIEVTESLEEVFVGGRVYVRFDHGLEPLGFQFYRSIRQMFLRRFNV